MHMTAYATQLDLAEKGVDKNACLCITPREYHELSSKALAWAAVARRRGRSHAFWPSLPGTRVDEAVEGYCTVSLGLILHEPQPHCVTGTGSLTSCLTDDILPRTPATDNSIVLSGELKID
ncbi:hypothetical protein ACKVB4_22950 (plasmid) [Escherichia coli]